VVNTFEVNKYNAMELFATHCRLIEIEKSSESADEARGAMERNILVMLQEMPWAVGRKPHSQMAPRLAVYEQAAAELTDEEMMLVAAGHETDEIKEVLTYTMPPPRRDPHNDANDKQGGGKSDLGPHK